MSEIQIKDYVAKEPNAERKLELKFYGHPRKTDIVFEGEKMTRIYELRLTARDDGEIIFIEGDGLVTKGDVNGDILCNEITFKIKSIEGELSCIIA